MLNVLGVFFATNNAFTESNQTYTSAVMTIQMSFFILKEKKNQYLE